jgi:OMF family outer membrane factor
MVLSALVWGARPIHAQESTPAEEAETPSGSGTRPVLERQSLPLAPQVKGERPKSDPSLLPPAATTLPSGTEDLAAPESLALPTQPSQVRIRELRPLGLQEVETLVEVNNPSLKALGLQVEQAQSALRAQISLWYPNIGFNASSFPSYNVGEAGGSRGTRVFSEQQVPTTTTVPTLAGPLPVLTGFETQRTEVPIRSTKTSIWRMQAALETTWNLIDPTRTPQIAAARDAFEQAKNQYLIGLRDLRLQANQLYFDLQSSDEQVRIGQESVRASLVSLRDARARRVWPPAWRCWRPRPSWPATSSCSPPPWPTRPPPAGIWPPCSTCPRTSPPPPRTPPG